jgi:hypothetical protein
MENPRDQHFKFHASAALKSALARAKTCADEFDDLAIPEPLIDRILTVLWANWEDPLTQTVKEIQGAFGHLLELNGKSPDFLDSRRESAHRARRAQQGAVRTPRRAGPEDGRA